MTKDKILLSVIIPVFNGAKYLPTVLESLLNQKVECFEILIGDDCSQDNSWQVICEYTDERIRKVKNVINLGMRDNYENLVGQARGEWITIIGQDDLFVDNAFYKFYKFQKKYKHAQILTSPRSYFFWDDESRNNKKIFSTINYGLNIITKHKSNKRHLKTILGIVNYHNGPQFYLGTFIKKSFIESIKLSQGALFAGNIPDVYSSIFLLNHSKYYYRIWSSLAIVGTSSTSVGYRISNEVEKKKQVTLDKQKMYFSKNLLNNPGNNGKIVSFTLYHFEELKIYLSKNKEYKYKFLINKKPIRSFVYASILSDIFQSSVRKNMHQISSLRNLLIEEKLSFLLVILFSILIWFIRNVITFVRCTYYAALFLIGRYRLNTVISKNI